MNGLEAVEAQPESVVSLQGGGRLAEGVQRLLQRGRAEPTGVDIPPGLRRRTVWRTSDQSLALFFLVLLLPLLLLLYSSSSSLLGYRSAYLGVGISSDSFFWDEAGVL